jgi:hypothetical protein
MNLLPSRKLIIHTQLTPQQCREKLQACTATANPDSMLQPQAGSAKFIGYVYGNGFKIRRIINYRNAFVPVITGQIKPLATGTEIAITIKPIAIVTVFMGLWLGILSFAFIGALISGIIKQNVPPAIFIMPLMLLGGGSIMYFGFNTEYHQAKKALTETFKSSNS